MLRHSWLPFVFAIPAFADDATDKLAKDLRDYSVAQLAEVPGKDGKFSTVLPDELRKQLKEANERERQAWYAVHTKADWEKFRDQRIAALRESLGTWPEVPRSMRIKITNTIQGDGYRIDNLLYESRPGIWVAGNLYYPAKPGEKSPVILIAHAHHAPKHEGELQDMGVTWAKLGCIVLVIDQLGHGERRQHPFNTAKDYSKPYRVSRQDYFFRYTLSQQLSLVGDSLMGWMAWDLMRGLDVALKHPGADKDRVMLLGSVAGGGDPAGVTAALDRRFTCVVPFNFGGPQPETRYPLPEDAETSFNYSGSGSWESTRNLRGSAEKGFLPWVIVASVAPRKQIHAHEFSWDKQRDPVWKRYQKVWGFYDAVDNISFTTGTGVIHGNDPTASHCNNIGPVHRQGIYTAFKKWFDIAVPVKDAKERRSAKELQCWTPEAIAELKPVPLHEVLGWMADEQLAQSRKQIAENRGQNLFDRFRHQLRLATPDLAGDTIKRRLAISDHCEAFWGSDGSTGIRFRGLVLTPKSGTGEARFPGVICVGNGGPHAFLRDHASAIAILIRSGVAVVLPELTGTGSERPGDGRGRTSFATSLSATSQMVGASLMSQRFGSLSLAIDRAFGVDHERIALWGENRAPSNAADSNIAVPAELNQPSLAEPFAATMVGLLGLNRPGVKAVLVRGALVSYRSVLKSPFVHVPHDALPIDVFRAGDLPDAWAQLAPKSLRLEGLVDGTNRRVSGKELDEALKPVSQAYAKGGLVVKDSYSSDAALAKWLAEQLKK